MSVWTRKVRLGLGTTQTNLSLTKESLDAIDWMVRCMPSPGSPDYKRDDPEYKALRAQASHTLETFSQFLSTPAAIEVDSQVDYVFCVLRNHGEKAGLLFPPLIRAISGYLNAYKKARGEVPRYLKTKEEWVRSLYHTLKPDYSRQVCLLYFCSYRFGLSSIFTLTQNPPIAAVMASASSNTHNSDSPLAQSTSAAAEITLSRASHAVLSAQSTSSARLEVSLPEASPLTSFHAPPTTTIQDPASVELTPSSPMSEDPPAPQADPGPAQIYSGEVSETPAPVGSGGPSNANPQKTELSSTEIPSLPWHAVQISGHPDPSEES